MRNRPLSMIARAAVLTALALSLACSGDDDDTGSKASEDDETTTTLAEGEGSTPTTEPSEPLPPAEARAEGNPATYERIAALTDCGELAQERDTARENASRRADDPRRQSILEEYAKAAEARMAELNCEGV